MSAPKTKQAYQTTPAVLPDTLFNHKPGEFIDRFNRLPFLVSHNLARHPLFEIPRLASLAKSLWGKAGGKVLFQEGIVGFDKRWDAIPRKAISFIEGITSIQESGSWAVLKSVQQHPEYKSLVDGCVSELSEIIGLDLQKKITWLEGYVFVASPGAVTPYHIDHEANFLLQIHGEKTMKICDPADRSVLSEEEIENYYVGDLSAARYREEHESKAFVFELAPGNGVHIPSRGPHWVRNGNRHSISFSINFCLKDIDLRARIYQVNHYLRRLNLQPSPPGRSAIKDHLKIIALGNLRRTESAANKYELLRQNVRRIDKPFRMGEKLLRRSRRHNG
jgi:hypothetical protein